MQPKKWITEFLYRHNFSHPDKRPLYQYRITDVEFESLRQVMKLSARLGLSLVSKQLPRWDAAFVIYAAEWWRREYDGSLWSWNKIFASFDADYQDLNTFTRNHMVETGLRFWGRKVRVLNGQSRYIGSIAIEGGLPLHQLTGSGGWLGRVFKSAIPKFIRLQNSGVTASMIVSEYVDYFPQTYRNEQIYSILGDMVQTVAELKKEYQLEQHTNPVDWLDSHSPAWREKFPLPLDQDVSAALLSDMLYTAVKAQESIGAPFRVIRQLSDGHELQMTIELLPFVFLEDEFSSKSLESIPARMDVELLDHLGTSRSIGLAFKMIYQSKPAIKMNRTSYRLKGDDASHGYFIRFKSLGEIIADIPLVGGEELDAETPWIFTQQAEEWVLEGIASVSTRASKIRIFHPEHFTCRPVGEASQLTEIGTSQNRKLVEAIGAIECKDNQENSFIIKTGQSGQNPVSYYLTGNVLSFQSSPKEVFKGIPKLIRVDKETGAKKEILASQLIARPINTKGALKSLLQVGAGIYEIRKHDQQGCIVFRKYCTLLDEKFDIRLIPGAKHSEGSIYLDHSGQALVSCDTANVRKTVEVNPDKNGCCIRLTAEDSPPTTISLTLSWPGMPEMLYLSVPFPARGGQVIAPNGDKLSRRQSLFQDRLHGYRLRLFSERPDRTRTINLDFNLIDNELSDTRDLYFSKSHKVKGAVIDLPVIDYLEWIQKLLSISRSLDSYIRLAIRESGAELLVIKIYRYQMALDRDINEGCVLLQAIDSSSLSHNQIAHVSLMAMRLAQPEQRHIKLEPKLTENTETGSWLFEPEKKEPGPWLIYPAEDSSVNFRPILWDIKSIIDQGTLNDLPICSLNTAITIGNPMLRKININAFLSEMPSKFDHKGWEYLRNLWRKCPHLPLATFDIWTLAVTNTRVLAALVLQMDEKFISRLTSELPVLWELIPLNDWLFVIDQYDSYLKNNIDDENDVRALIEKRITRIGELSDSMRIVSQLISAIKLGTSDQELNLMKLPIAESIVRDEVNAAYQELCRCQADSEWPEMLGSELMLQWAQTNMSLQNLLLPQHQLPHHMPVAVLPILLASFCLTSPPDNWIGDSIHIFKIKQLKAFDEQWFSTVFKFVVAYQSQQAEAFKEINTYA